MNTHPFIHSLIHSFAHSLIHPLCGLVFVSIASPMFRLIYSTRKSGENDCTTFDNNSDSFHLIYPATFSYNATFQRLNNTKGINCGGEKFGRHYWPSHELAELSFNHLFFLTSQSHIQTSQTKTITKCKSKLSIVLKMKEFLPFILYEQRFETVKLQDNRHQKTISLQLNIQKLQKA